MHITLIIYRNVNDFVFGTWSIRTGSAWMEITGRLKKTGKMTLYARMEYRNGKGKEIITRGGEEDC